MKEEALKFREILEAEKADAANNHMDFEEAKTPAAAPKGLENII